MKEGQLALANIVYCFPTTMACEAERCRQHPLHFQISII